MFWNRYFLPSFLLLVIVASLHWTASALAYYWTLGWYDIMMHFLGGAWVVLFTLWILRMDRLGRLSSLVTVRNLLLVAFFVGITWEIYEVVLKFADTGREGYAIDTSIDIVMDMLGASAAVLLCRKDIASFRNL